MTREIRAVPLIPVHIQTCKTIGIPVLLSIIPDQFQGYQSSINHISIIKISTLDSIVPEGKIPEGVQVAIRSWRNRRCCRFSRSGRSSRRRHRHCHTFMAAIIKFKIYRCISFQADVLRLEETNIITNTSRSHLNAWCWVPVSGRGHVIQYIPAAIVKTSCPIISSRIVFLPLLGCRY